MRFLSRRFRLLLSFALFVSILLFAETGILAAENLERGFAAPPDDAKPRVYWWWLFNRVDKDGITRDLEQFKAKGISGVNLICTGGYAGAAPLAGVVYQSPAWWDLFSHAVKEAKRLNIELGFNFSAGGWVMEAPWVTPDNAMKKVVFANLNVQGPTTLSAMLPQPEIVDGYYHDYCVQAIPHASGGAINPADVIDLTANLQPDGQLVWNVPAGSWTILRTGYTLTGSRWWTYPQGDTFAGGDGYELDALKAAALDDHFAHLGQPILDAARQAGGQIAYFWSDSWESGKLTWTQDFPEQFLKYRGYDLKPYLAALPGAISWIDYTATFTATATTHSLSFVGTDLAGGDHTIFIDNVQIVSSGGTSVTVPNFGFETPSLGSGHRYNPVGGAWTFSGNGSIPTGSGLCCNGSAFSNPKAPQGAQVAFLQATGTISQAISGLVPGTSYTITFSAAQRPGNAQTWNVKIDNAVIGSYQGTGATVVNDNVTARFRADFDRTIQDCVADNFYGHFADLCHSNGMIMGSEAGGPNNIPPEDALKNSGRCDFPAGEFWVNGHYNASGGYNSDPWLKLNLKQTASAAHTYGLVQAQAESFTQQERDRTHWSLGPLELKPYANDAFCWGINRIMLHQATCQPPSDGKPGYEFCAGQHWTPNVTWWEQSPAFFTYLSRCSYLLQQGKFVGDVCFYLGEQPPTLAPPKYVDPALGSGYDCDYCNADVLLNRMSVTNGLIVLPDGMSYRLLVLQNCVSTSQAICNQVGGYQSLTISSTPSKAMSVEVITKLRALVLAGATIIGAPPVEAAGLANYPQCDAQVQSIAAEMWGNLDGTTRTQRSFGLGRVIWGQSPRTVLLADGVKPDFTFTGQDTQPGDLDYIHRTAGDAEIYFVINRLNQSTTRTCTFRVTGKQPEIFDPVNGSIRPAGVFQQVNGCTTLPLRFDSFGSCFVVFRQPIATGVTGTAAENFSTLAPVQTLANSWNVAFDPAWGGPTNAVFASLVSWVQRPEQGIKYYSGKATYHQTFNLTNSPTGRLFLDLGDVRNIADVRLNGQELGILWCFPWRVEITGTVRPTNNVLEVDVINYWANRVIGDLNLPAAQRLTKTHDVFRFDMLTASTPLLDSGLLGPVSVLQARNDLVNGSFEIPAIGNYQYSPSGAFWSFGGSPGNGSGIVANGSGFGNPNAPDGSQAAFVQGYGRLSQTLSGLVPGTIYTITYSAADRGQYHNGESWNLMIDNSVIQTNAPASLSYSSRTASFTATAPTHTLSFVGTDLATGDNTVFIDNVRISPPLIQYPLPSVTLTGPTNNACFPSSSINLAATVAANGNAINSVQFFANTTNLIGQASLAPYTVSWDNVRAGNYSLVAAVSFNDGGVVNSPAVNITVTNLPPVLSGIGFASGTQKLFVSGTAQVGQAYVLVRATNLLFPVVWSPVMTNIADSSGNFCFTNVPYTDAQSFYRIFAN